MRPLKIFLIAGEPSGDRLGAALMAGLREEHPGVTFSGVGGPAMVAEGLISLFSMDDIAVMGFTAVLGRLPTILRRISEAAAAAVAAAPDVLVIIDSPDFTHRVARRVRAARPRVPIVAYVGPTVWAWRPGRAAAMTAYVDRLLAILPFEPAVHVRLGGPATVYVGHPLTDTIPSSPRPAPAPGAPGRLLVLPGSRRGEIDRLMEPFGAAVAALRAEGAPLTVDLVTLPRLRDEIERRVATWPVRPVILTGDDEKRAAFGRAHAALAASGTVTLELALAGVPMVVAYRLDWIARRIRTLNRLVPIVTAPSMVLANIVLGERSVPEHLEEEVTAARLASDLRPLLADTPARRRQIEALSRLRGLMTLPHGEPPARAAARAVLEVANRGR